MPSRTIRQRIAKVSPDGQKLTPVPLTKELVVDPMVEGSSITATFIRPPHFLQQSTSTLNTRRNKLRDAFGFVLVDVSHGTSCSLVALRARAWDDDGAVDEDRFVTFIAERVVPKLSGGDVVVMDNVKFHKGPEVKALVEKVGARVLFIPAYHPELNAIEEAFSVVKRAVRRAEPRTIVALCEALASAFAFVVVCEAPRLRRAYAWLRDPTNLKSAVNAAEFLKREFLKSQANIKLSKRC